MAESYTNSSLACARRCLTEYDFRYNQRLELIRDKDRETLAVGELWHHAHDVAAKGGDPYSAIRAAAPSSLWAVKLERLFAAYAWYWKTQSFEIVESERIFAVESGGWTFRGRIDAVVKLPDGRVGVLERKTTADGMEAESNYWTRLRMDVQVGIYALALDRQPEFILYDAVRKPTISPKRLEKLALRELEYSKRPKYYGEELGPQALAFALREKVENDELYGARLTADIGNRPEHYFARREVPRTKQDFQTLIDNLQSQVRLLQFAEQHGLMHRNPDACDRFGLCDYFGLCSNNIRPAAGDPPPSGYARRAALHPELEG